MSNYVTRITCSNLVRLGQAVPELMELLTSQADRHSCSAQVALVLSCIRV